MPKHNQIYEFLVHAEFKCAQVEYKEPEKHNNQTTNEGKGKKRKVE